jgi:serine/threonine protein phosphatase 1
MLKKLLNIIKGVFEPHKQSKKKIGTLNATDNQLKNADLILELPKYKFNDPHICIAAFGDIHGRIDLLHQLSPALDKAAQDPARSLLEIYLGDYVDRGSNPKAVIQYLIDRSNLTDRQVICLAGNHEQMMIAALDNDNDFKRWLDFGGQSTLLSYGISPVQAGKDIAKIRIAFVKAVPQTHVDFLRNLPTSYAHAGFFFAHAGVRPKVPLSKQKDEDLLWIRNPFLTSFADFGAVIVHGHTPGAKPIFKLNRIGIDTGAYRTGVLTCLVITSDKIALLDTGHSRQIS